jgi:3-isopropylmalate/(R)-2-methylmalate dehydratase large subunit
MGTTLYDKIWESHLVDEIDGEALIYIDLHLLHEISSPQAFAGLAAAGRPVRRPDLARAVADHNVPTERQSLGLDAVEDPGARAQLAALAENVRRTDIAFFPMGHPDNGIVHVVAPEMGWTQPGMTIVCGDSHTSTHGALGALAHGIGTSEVEHVLATQTLRQSRSRNMRVRFDGTAGSFVSAKDMGLALIAEIGTGGGIGHVIEYAGSAVEALSIEGRMTLCNLTIEAGARAGLVAPDEKSFAYIFGRPGAPTGEAWDRSLAKWRELRSDANARFDREVVIDMTDIAPMVSWGTSPDQTVGVTGTLPDPASIDDAGRRAAAEKALVYMGLEPGRALAGTPIDRVFIGSCTNSRIEDLRAAAAVAAGRRVRSSVRALVVPGSGRVKAAAEAEGLDRIFRDAGFEWREPGCSMCPGMNADRLAPGERCASTSNRNFEGRQGPGGRTHLMSPAMAAAAAVHGEIVDVRETMS